MFDDTRKNMKLLSSKIAAMSFLVVLAISFDAYAQQATKPETLIKWRQSAFQVVAWSSSRIKKSMEGQDNKDEVIKAANTIAAIANSGLGGLFTPNTEQGKGWHETSVKPELFKDTKRVDDLAINFSKEATETCCYRRSQYC